LSRQPEDALFADLEGGKYQMKKDEADRRFVRI
jgi:hypothetical protein